MTLQVEGSEEDFEPLKRSKKIKNIKISICYDMGWKSGQAEIDTIATLAMISQLTHYQKKGYCNTCIIKNM